MPSSWLPLSVRGNVHVQLGYGARGNEYTRETSEDAFDAMRDAFAQAMTGAELDKTSDQELEARVDDVSVFARATAEQKPATQRRMVRSAGTGAQRARSPAVARG